MRIALLTLSVVAGCGHGQEQLPAPEPPPPEEPAREPEASPPPPAAYEVHEWGFIAVEVGRRPGDPVVVAAGSPWRVPRRLRMQAPVVYVHLPAGVPELRFEATLALGRGGRLVEHWPEGRIVEEGGEVELRWGAITARAEGCTILPYPIDGSPHCNAVTDRFCEVTQLNMYETEDGACLHRGEERANHLFYRASIPAELPLVMRPQGTGFTVENGSQSVIPSKLLRVRRTDDEGGTRVAVLDPPPPGRSLQLVEPTAPVGTGVDAIRAALSAAGLTGPETEAFLRAWQGELFGAPVPSGTFRIEPDPTPPPADALLYWLPPAAYDGLAELRFEPRPAERRAILVRVDLAPVAPP